MYVYYRSTDMVEIRSLDGSDQLPSESGVTYWTDGLEPSRLYQYGNRKIVKIVLDRPLPEQYKGIAEGVDEKGNINNHREWVMPKKDFNEFIGRTLEDVIVID